jgi:hypothetical protein
VASLFVGAWAAAEVCASAALGNPLKIRVASSNPRFQIPWVIEPPLGCGLVRRRALQLAQIIFFESTAKSKDLTQEGTE